MSTRKGWKHSIESRRKMSEIAKLRPPISLEHREKISRAHKASGLKPPSALGTKQTQEHIAKRIKTRSDNGLLARQPSTREKISKTLTGRHATIEARIKMSLSRSGRTVFTGFIKSENELVRRSPAYKTWRTAVFERDNYTCVLGGKDHGSRLQADHIKPFAHYPELRFDINNGRTLCIDCHRKTDTWGGKTRR